MNHDNEYYLIGQNYLNAPEVILANEQIRSNTSICIGFGSQADDYGIAIGKNARSGKNAAAFGENVKAADNHLVIGQWDLTDIANGTNDLHERVIKLESLVKKQQELLTALWYHPGMPGSIEAQALFDQHYKNNDSL
jgi:hypothetical protein